MSIKELLNGVKLLVKKRAKQKAVTLQDKLTQEYIVGYNQAIVDVLELILKMKKEIKDGHKEKVD